MLPTAVILLMLSGCSCAIDEFGTIIITYTYFALTVMNLSLGSSAIAMTMDESTTVTAMNTDVSTIESFVTNTAGTVTSFDPTVVTATSTPADVQSTSVPGSVAESGNIFM